MPTVCSLLYMFQGIYMQFLLYTCFCLDSLVTETFQLFVPQQ